MFKKILSTLLLFLLVWHISGQQLKEFSQDPQIYLDEMLKLFSRSETNYDKGKELIKKFEEPWLNGGFSNEKQLQVIKTSNLLLKKNAQNFPHFYDYLNTILIFREMGDDSLNYVEWEQGLLFLTTNKKIKLTNIADFINSTLNLITKNAIYASPSVSWYTDNKNYKIKLDGDTLKFVFDGLNLTGMLRKDSITINNTSGVFYPLTNEWKGNSAQVYWEKTGISRDTAWAEIDEYNLFLDKSFYSIPNVHFYHKGYFNYSILGTLTDKVVEVTSEESLSYPRFDSNEKQFIINGIFKDINYKGGFSMQGSRLLGSGTVDNYATLSIYRNVELVQNGDTIIEKQLFMKTYSKFYAFSLVDIVSRNAKISFFISGDSIYHPGLMFRYYDKNHEIHLIRDNDSENMSRSPYYNTYHKVEMDFELLTWQMGKEEIDFSMLRGSSINIARFESDDYFSASRYYEIQGLEQVHPYISLRKYAKLNQTETFTAEEFAKFLKLPLAIVKRLLIELTYKGIVYFDFETEQCTIKPKLYTYLDAIVGKRDYDLIQFESRTDAPLNNAVLNLKNMDLAIQGVPRINLSDSQNVIFYPKNQEILLKKNRNFDFGGSIEAGFFTFYGDNFQFKYDSFKIVLNKVDSLSIQVKSGIDNWGRRVLSNVQNVIEEVSGDLVIDDPGNKSGVKDFPNYPIFASKKDSYVYYDAPSIQKGKYKRDRFYYIVYPYAIDSLNNFSTEGMGYKGELHSTDIFPVIKQELVLQPDNSLGFHHNTPQNGLPLFKGKGQYFADVNLSNQGLRGNGAMTYLTSKVTSDNFIFYPDSANTKTTAFEIKKQNQAVQYPEVIADKVYVHWMPYQDELNAKVIEKPFNMYSKKATHKGSLLYTPKMLTGKGNTSYNNGTLSSKLFTYQADRFISDTAGFKLASINPDMLAMETDNLNARVDFIEMKSTFQSNSGASKVDLPENLYQASVEKFTWMMDKKNIQLSTPNTVQVYEFGKSRIVTRDEAGLKPKGSLFVSVHKGQDSLNWVSPESDFDLATNTLSAHQVKYINVADATIFPFEGEVTIEPKAYMRTLTKAEVLANNDTKYHRFHSSTINISSRKLYHGQGKYNYEDELGRQLPINFELIAVDSLGQTFGRGKIKGTEDFSLSPAFKFQGNVSLVAKNKLLNFNGSAQITHECTQLTESWIKFSDEIDPNRIFIPLSDPLHDINDAFLVSGAMLATDSIHVFPSFVSPRKLYSNLPVTTASGYLTYDSKEKSYKIGSKERIAKDDTTGNFLSLHKNLCQLSSEGNIDLTSKLGQVKIETKGSSLYKIPEDRLSLELLMTINFILPEGCIKKIGDTLSSMSGLKPVNLKSRTYTQGVRELLSFKEADQLLKEQNIFGTVKKLPDALLTTFVLTDLNLVWNKNETSWQSVGDIGIATVLGTQVNRKIKGNLEIQRKRSGDSFVLYLEFSANHWYFFHYKRGLMQAYSSEGSFNEIITAVKGSDRKLKIEQGEESYVFFLSDKKKRDDFLKRLQGEKVDEEENIEFEEGEDTNSQQYEDLN